MHTEYDFRGCVAFSYARFSDPIQSQGHSLERQQSYAPEFCQEYGCALDATLSFSDEGKSAFHGRHISEGGGLARFLAMVDAGRVRPNDILIIENLDRVSRLPLEQAEDLLKSILSKGVRIHTRSPWAVYDRSTLNDPMQRMAMIFEFTRSHRESKYKQERLSRRWIANRERIKTGDYHLANCPAWLRCKRDAANQRIGYEVIESRVAIVKAIFKLCIDGYGIHAIAGELNRTKTPTFGKSNNWSRSTVYKILHNRSVLGEYQPFSSVGLDGKDFRSIARVATGDPVKKHYPQIIDRKTFERAELALSKRNICKTGAGTKHATNLFSGMLFDVRDQCSMQVIDKGFGPQLVSDLGRKGLTKAVYIPYPAMEKAFIAFVDKMPLDMIAPKADNDLLKQIADTQKSIESLELQVEKIRSKLRLQTSDVLLDLLVERDAELKEKKQSLDVLERQKGTSASVAAKTSQQVLKLFKTSKGEDLLELRRKLRSELRYWIKRVNVLPLRLGKSKAAIVCVDLANGEQIKFRVSGDPVVWPSELDNVDIVKYPTWKKDLKRIEWEAVSIQDQKIAEMDDAGMPLVLIASELGTNTTTVSRTLNKLGRRRANRTTLGGDRQMTWNKQANGWQRTYRGHRYYIGAGSLKSLYPKLVKETNESGTLKAANRWWKEHGPQ